MVEAARRQRRRRRPRPHGHPRAGGAGTVAGAEAGAPQPPLEARLCGVPPRLRGLPRLLQLPPCLVSLGTDWIAALGCLLAVKGLLQESNSSKRWMWYSFYVGMAVSIFWTYYLLKLPRIRWDVVWLPLGPLIASALSLYVDHTLVKSMQDISTLRSYMYNFKSL